MPYTTSVQAAKQLHALAKPYDCLAEVFETSLKNDDTRQNLIREASVGAQIWADVS